MKKSYFWGLLFAVIALIPGQNVFAQVAADQLPTGYCSVTKRMNENCTGSDVNNVHSHSIQGLTATYEGSEVLSLSATSTTFNDLTSSKQFTVGQGGTIEISFTNGTWSKNVWFGFDWDRDGDFEDVVAAYGEEGRVGGNEDQGSVTIYVPDDAQAGKSVMRIISDGVDCATSWSEETPMCGTHGTGYIGYAGSLHDVTIIVEEVELEGEIFTISVSSNDDTMGAATAESTSVRDGRPATLTATANEGYKFVNWTVEGTEVSTENPYTATITAETAFVANFEALSTYAVSVAANNDAFGSVEASAESVFEGSTVTLTATANEGYKFVNWTVEGTEVSTENPYTATITAETAFVANFELDPTLDRSAWTATASSYEYDGEGSAGGWPEHTIDDDPATFWHSDYSVSQVPTVPHWLQYNLGSVQKFTSFNYVSRNETSENITCNGNVKTYKLYVSNSDISANLGAGYVPNDLTAISEGDFVYDGTSAEHIVDLGAEYEGQYVFLLITDSWNSDPSTKFGNCSEFYLYYEPTEAPTYTVTAVPSDGAMGAVSPETSTVEEGETVVLTATPVAGYVFKNWTVGTEEVSTENPYTATITAETAFVANFEKAPADDATLALIEEAKALIVKDGVGYPSATAKATFKEALDVAENNPYAGAATALQAAMDAYIATDDIVLPTADKAYAFISRGKTANFYMYNNAGTLALASYTEGMELPATAMFVCQYDGEASKYVFKTSDGAYYLAYPSPGKGWLNDKSETGLETELRRVSQFSIETLTIDGTNVVATPEDLFGYVHLWGYRGNETKNGVTSDFNGPMVVTSAGAFDGAGGDFYNSITSSAFSVIEVELPTPTFAVSAVSADATMGSATVSAAEVEEGAEATFTATANAGYKFTCWTVGTDTISTENPYTATISAATELTANFEALVPAIVLTATPDVERQFLFTVETAAKIFIDWGNGELVETETITEAWKEGGVIDPEWANYNPTIITGTTKGEGVIKIYGDIVYFDCGYSDSYGSKVTALDVTNAPYLVRMNISSNEIPTLDLSNNTMLYTLTLDNNTTLTSVTLPSENQLISISALNCALTSFNVSSCLALKSLVLNGNAGLGTLDVSANTALTELKANGTGLTTIDLSANTSLNALYLNDNQLTSLDVSQMRKGDATRIYIFANNNNLSELITSEEVLLSSTRINVLNNKFTMSTLPVISGINAYNYAPQQAMTIATEINEGDELDLSSEAMVGENATVYTWYTAADNAEFTNYTVENGKFVFDVTADTELYCSMTNATFNKFSGSNVLKTTNIVVKNVAVDTYSVNIATATGQEALGTVEIVGYEGTSANIEAGTEITIVATPAEGYALEGWYDITGATLLSTDLSYTFTVTAETTVVAWFMEVTPEEPEYCTTFGTSTRTNGDRKLTSFTLSDGANESTIDVNQQNGYGAQIYFDKTDVNVSLEAGKTITSDVNWIGEWMHSYLFVDWNNDAEFTRNLGTNLVPEEDSELIAFSFWSGVDGNSQENEGYNSAGQYITGDNRSVWSLPEFTIPTSISEGTYRARLKIDWNTVDPCSVMSTQDAPCVVDFMITVTYPDGIADADADAVQVYAANGVIYINGYEGDVKVVNATGQVVKDVMVNGAEQLNVNAGLYMVVTGNQVTKVVVK